MGERQPPGHTAPLIGTHEVLPSVYDDLRRIAAHRLAALGPGQTLQPTALVHEAWIQLSAKEHGWKNHAHFVATAAEVIRHILIDHIRAKTRLKRGGGQPKLPLEDLEISSPPPDERLLLIHEALEEFERDHPNQAKVVVLKFFGGLTDREVAAELGVTERTVERHWAYARAWLVEEIGSH